MKKLQFALATVATLAVAQAAHATLTVNSSVGGGAPSGTTKYNLNENSLNPSGGTVGDLTLSFTGNGKVVTGNDGPSTYAEPYFSGQNNAGFGPLTVGPDPTQYVTTGTGTATLTFAKPLYYIGFVWGSVDNYNTLTLKKGNTVVGSLTPPVAGIPLPSPGGDQKVNGTYWVNITSDIAFDTVVASSTQYAFEFDNIATIAVPEPSTYIAGALLLLPFGAGAVRSLRSRQQAA